ncbi:MAG: haloacid dehalogenase superfamily protein subfamily variant 3 with third motif having or [Moraxellaceae bacterium]|nr:haloacid dehalogenase superfamily protein subfamily variant 3 with third motif having or [Moraxellaceae bacterium]
MTSMPALVDWARIDTVLLDMDGTLLDLYFDNQFWLHHLPAVYGRERGMDTDAAREDLVARFGREQGTLNWYCVDFWTQELGLDIAGLKRDLIHLIQPRPGAFAFLQAVRDSGRSAWLVTNAHHHSLSLKLAHTPLTDLCDRILCSHDFREPKESAAFWPALQRQEPFEPARALFVDDSESVLRAAHDFGIGQLLTIGQPDSRRPTREGLHFPVLHHFDDLLPIPPRHAPA